MFQTRCRARPLALTLAATAAIWFETAAQDSVSPEFSPPAQSSMATRDYVAPTDFVVVDVEATVTAAAAAGAQLPVVVRSAPGVAEAAVAEFDAAFSATRRAFRDALEQAFGSRVLDRAAIDSARFRSFRSEFQADNTGVPLSLALAQAWAEGDDAEARRERLSAVLRATMTGRLIGDVRPASTVYVATLTREDRIRTWSEASAHARAVDHGDIATIEAAGATMRRSLDVLDRAAGGFLASLLRPNLIADDYLTALLLQERLGVKAIARAWRRGEPIVRAGSPVDREAAAALAHLGRMGIAPDAPSLETPPPTPAAHPAAEPASVPAGDALESRRWWLVVGGSVGALALAGLGLAWSARRHGKIRRAAANPRWLDQPTASPPPANVREALLPHLARELKNRLVHALFAQRQELLHNEAAATQRVADLEERLAKLQPAIAEKIRSYELRIQALEAEIEEKDQETRDLLRAKLVLARKELDAEVKRQHIRWN